MRQARRNREAAVPDDFCGHALAHLALGLWVDGQGEIRMGLDVDETRCDGEASCFDYLRCAGRSQIADRRDMAFLDSNIGSAARTAASIKDRATADQEVVLHRRCSECDCARSIGG